MTRNATKHTISLPPSRKVACQKVNGKKLVPLVIIYGGKIVETARSDLKIVQICQISSFLGLEIRPEARTPDYDCTPN